ncbi:glycerophosphodiester phosphodiesterase family protein [Diaphorobacter caeni]|uniref:glycerophosphodiester phosphodiesterase family protein n=1 Tax=Diaphorobacter caeni TaxID=2784387 RepID=UPI00188E0A82|nr:glycerophosphodiester phosphodiesterase family protein [Diaphorobacter caeni]MBF5005326.1 glycerophosphodiester phosphodiesterase [Diaphorobacter caeni]
MKKPIPTFRLASFAAAACAALTLTACGGGDDSPYKTLHGDAPQIIAHRGLSGYYPEQTRMAYEKAVDAGADMIELDMHLTRDCQLVARHNAWLSDSTNIAEVAKTNAAVASRKRTTKGVLVDVKYPAIAANGPAQYLSDQLDPNDPKSVLKPLVVDGEDHTDDWSISDFTMAELREWIAGTTLDNRSERPTEWNGKLPIISAQDVIDIAVAKGKAQKRTIPVYAETKNPYWNNQQAIANGCGKPGSSPLEDAVIALLEKNKLNTKDSPIYIQSFDPASLKYLRKAGMKAKGVQLIDGNDINYRDGSMVFITSDEWTFISGRPYSWTLAGDARTFAAMLTPAGLAEIKTYADGIGPWKPEVLAHSVVPYKEGAGLKDVNTLKDTGLIANAHKAGLVVHSFTFRNEPGRLAGIYKGDPVNEFLAYFRLGIDGVFTDFANTGVAARKAYDKELGLIP